MPSRPFAKHVRKTRVKSAVEITPTIKQKKFALRWRVYRLLTANVVRTNRLISKVPLAYPALLHCTKLSVLGKIMKQKRPMHYVLQQTLSIVFRMAWRTLILTAYTYVDYIGVFW
jgi:hypothetical protein